MINIKDFDSNLLKIDKKLYKDIDISYIGYITMKDYDYIKINRVNSLYLIIDKVDVCIEEKNGNKYLTLVSTNKNQKLLTKYTELWSKFKNQTECNSIGKVNGGKADEYKKYFVQIQFKGWFTFK